MYYPDETVDEVLRANNIVDVVGSYVHLQKKGANYFGLCPFHNEKSPSFSVSEPKQMFYCFGCGAGGNAATFLMKYENYSFQEALQALADRAGIKLPEDNYSEEARGREEKRKQLLAVNKEAAVYYYKLLRTDRGRRGMEYLLGRQLSRKTMQDFGLGYADGAKNDLTTHLRGSGFSDELILEAGVAAFDEKRGMHDKFWNRVMFPIMDIKGRVIGFGGRVMGDAKPKYLNSPETSVFDKSRNLYGLHIAKRTRENYFILCEGYMDVIAMHQAGFHEAVASLGTSFTEGQAALLKRYVKRVLLAYDSDGAGVRAALRGIGILKRAGIEGKVMDLRPAKDPDEFIKTFGTEAFRERIRNAENSFFFELRQMESEYAMDDPAQRTQFHHAIAGKLCEFTDDLERDNYLKEAANRYFINEESLRSLVAVYGRAENVGRYKQWGGRARQRAAERAIALGNTDENGVPLGFDSGAQQKEQEERSGRRESSYGGRRKVSAEESVQKNERLLLTWLADEPEIFPQVNLYVQPAHFEDGIYRQAAEGFWKTFARGGNGSPASVIGMFETGEEQEAAASLFNTRLDGLRDEKAREKALRDIILSIRRASAERDLERAQENAGAAQGTSGSGEDLLTVMVRSKKELQELQKIHLRLPSLAK